MRKIPIDRRNHFRAILTDTLPYEIPLFFTNERLFAQVSKSNGLMGFPTLVSNLLLQRSHTKPFVYQVQKGGGSHRKLAIPHPAAQLAFAMLYKDFDAFIENVCSRSSYSLRYPTRVGSHFFQSQFASDMQPSGDVDADPSSFSTQRRWASSYFSYKQFTHIHKFFGSEEFSRLEQKFSMMLKLDIARCFESIYTHSISWAVRGKEFSKANKHGFFFEAEFDSRMQEANWGETNGILIGPEVSRIFAEAIIQSIDVDIERSLADLHNKISIRRYVDDFFVFGNSTEDLLHAKKVIEDAASQFNLHINEKKTEIVSRPLISSFSVARQRVAHELKSLLASARASLSDQTDPGAFSRFAADRTIAEIRRIAKENNVDYSTLASPAMAIIARGMHNIRRRTDLGDTPNSHRTVDRVTYAALRVSAFLFLMDIRSATSHKLAKIFFECSLLNEKHNSGRAAFEGTMMDVVRLALEQARLRQISGPEIINVLVAADSLCRTTRGISEDLLRQALGVQGKWGDQSTTLNYFELISVLYFSRDKHSFQEARQGVVNAIKSRVKGLGRNLRTRAEETMLFFDLVGCPYVDEPERLQLFVDVSISHGSTADLATHTKQFRYVKDKIGFVAWEGADHFQAMLERRELQSAYDS